MKDSFCKKLIFMPDKHCNDKGYGVIAQNTYNALVEYKILPEDGGEKPGAENVTAN